ncbi:MAG: helix-hairpin-helix domain-containing protein [Methanobrevibacter sp.]|nr:helix-hairpin-helix domain-containing protein [Methanobrevibacter sp.]
MVIKNLSKELNIEQTKNIIELFNQGNTIPFIANYRKDITGSCSDQFLRTFRDRLVYLRNLNKMKDQVIKTITEQNKLDEKIEKCINETKSLLELTEIYRPYVSEEETKADIAKKKGLESLANIIRFQQTKIPIPEIAEDYIFPEKGVKNIQEAISGAQDIMAEIIANNADFKVLIQKITFEEGELSTIAIDENQESEYEMYYNNSEPLISISNHRILAINRGEDEEYLKVEVEAPKEDIIKYLNRHFLIDRSEYHTQDYNEITRKYMEEAILRAYNQLIAPSVQEEIRNYLTMRAESKSLELFSNNLENLLMQGPIQNKVVLGWNPSLYTGTKLVVIDEVGDVLDSKEIFFNESQDKIDEGKNIVLNLIKEYNVDIIALGDVSDSKIFEKFIVEIIKGTDVKYGLVNQYGASIYSESELGENELPDFNKGCRTAISLARRLQDPLVELIKVDLKSIGVGQYQHDLDQNLLDDALNDVVEKVVNNVGADLNSASISLLSHIAGLNFDLATSIVNYRENNGLFTSREELLMIPEIDEKIFEQCAGFLKVYTSSNPLDYTRIHPESYDIAIKLLEKYRYTLDDIGSANLSFDILKKDLKDNFNNDLDNNLMNDMDNGLNNNLDNSLNTNSDNSLDNNLDNSLDNNLGNSLNSNLDNSLDNALKDNSDSSLEADSNDYRKLLNNEKLSNAEKIANELNISLITLKDIIYWLENPLKDPRDDMPRPILRNTMLAMENLKIGIELEGSVRNVVDFGAFVDIGVHHDGLVHISKMSQGNFVNHPSDIVSVGDIVKVKIIELDLNKKRIQLAMVL